MKKKLLIAALAMFCSAGTFAAQSGDYVFSYTAKYKLTGDNLVLNGDFNVGDGSEGWRNGAEGPMSDNWKVVTTDVGLGEGVNAIECQSASSAAADALTNSWQLGSGLYVITYSVYTAEDITCTVSEGGTNFVSFTAQGTDEGAEVRAISGA